MSADENDFGFCHLCALCCLFVQFVDDVLCFFLVWVANGACWANVFAAAAEDYAAVGVYGGFLFAVGCFCFEGLHVAELYTFAAGSTL
jgi:hypothetical protein